MKAQNDLKEMKVSVFKNVFIKVPIDEKPIEYLLEQIRINLDYEISVNLVRNELDKLKRKKLKEKLPCFTVSGFFREAKISGLLKHSNLICIDLDEVGDVQFYKTILTNDPYTFACFTSVSGKGLAVIVKIDGKKHRESFDGLAEYYLKLLSLPIDPTCKDVSRLRLISFDPDIYHNPDSKIFKEYLLKQKKTPPKKVSYLHINNFFEKLVFSINTDICENYNGWFEVGCSIASEYGASGLQYFRHISQFRDSSKANFEMIIDKNYEYFCNHNKSFTIGTFYYYAKKAGYEIVNKLDDSIAKTAYFVKTGGKDVEQAVMHVKKKFESKSENEIRI
ncbi:MAG: PriCT-2 domain-containing protein [Saprospiraceae bacterium]|nr:PriCT-2 domain-containing protein [Candidatus Defluviibacterium haderslevense]